MGQTDRHANGCTGLRGASKDVALLLPPLSSVPHVRHRAGAAGGGGGRGPRLRASESLSLQKPVPSGPQGRIHHAGPAAPLRALRRRVSGRRGHI